MNPHYQYSILEEFSNAGAGLQIKEDVLEQPSPPKEDYIPVEDIKPLKDSIPVGDSNPITLSVGSTVGRRAISKKPIDATDILPKEPIKFSDKPSLGSSNNVSIVSPPIFRGGAGGGGVKRPMRAIDKKSEKSILPLIIIGAGIAVLIFKPFK